MKKLIHNGDHIWETWRNAHRLRRATAAETRGDVRVYATDGRYVK